MTTTSTSVKVNSSSFLLGEAAKASLICFLLGPYRLKHKYKETLLEIEKLKELVQYDSESGNFWWLEPKRGRDLDTPAGTETPQGYRNLNINGHRYACHRLAFFYMTGEWPPEYVDHIDGNPRNNSWANLRTANAQQNAQNKKRKYNSYTGIKGVVKNFISDTWDVHMLSDGKVISRGPFYSYQAACREYDRLAKINFGEFARTDKPRAQRASFKNSEVHVAVEDFIKNKTLVNGRYVDVGNQHTEASMQSRVPHPEPRQD